MRKLLLVIGIIALSHIALGQSAAVSVNLKSQIGAAYQADAFVRVTLKNYSGNIPRVSAGVLTEVSHDYNPDAAGLVTFTTYVNTTTGNEITPAGTYYNVEYWAGGQMLFRNPYQFPVGSSNLATLTPATTPPIVTPPSGDTTYLRKDAGNSPVTGALSVLTLNGIRFSDQFASNQAAVNDAGVTGSVIIPPGATSDAFANSNLINIWNLRRSSYANFLKFSTFGLARNSGAGCNTFGDSITVGTGAITPSTGGYAALLTSSLGMVINNQAVAGSQAQDLGQIDAIYNTSFTQTSCTTWLPSYNDMRLNGTSATPLATAKNTIFAGVIHGAIPDAYRIAGSASGCVKTGAWTTNTGVYNNLPVYSTTNGNTISCANIRGTSIYVVLIAASTGGGQATISVDGVQYGGTYNLFTYAASNAGRTYSPFVVRVPNLKSGAHTVLITVVSATNIANSVNVVEVAGNGGRDYAGPDFYLGKVLHMTAVGYALFAPFNNGSDNAVDAYNSAIDDICRQVTEDGLGVVCVDTSRYNPTLDVSADNIHPADIGHQHITDAFLTAMSGLAETREKAASFNLGRRSYMPLYSPQPGNFGMMFVCVDANNCQIATNRDPVTAINLNPAVSGTAINFSSDGVITFYTTSAGVIGTATEVFRTTAAGKISTPAQFISTLATGTAPFSIASTTNVANLNASSLSGATFAAPGTIGGGTPAAGTFTALSAATYGTATNCSGVGTAANPSVASCGSAAAGSFSCDPAATGATCKVNTTAVTANSQIFVQEDETLGTKLGVTCNTGTNVLPASRLVAARVAATSFTINLGTVTTNPACFSYFIVN
jgi:hypothetical protein